MADRPLPPPETAIDWLKSMTLIRRFEERAGEQNTRAKVGGFLHLAIGEEATIVGAVAALRPTDYMIATYRSHGQALARGSEPGRVMAELFGRVDGLCRGRGFGLRVGQLVHGLSRGRGLGLRRGKTVREGLGVFCFHSTDAPGDN